MAFSYYSPCCTVMRSCSDIFRHCLLLTGVVKVILNTCLWSTAPDDCQLSPTLSIWPFDSRTHRRACVRAGTHSYTNTHAEWEIIGSWLQQTDWVLASQTQTCLSVTRLEKIWLVGAHHRARNDGSEGGLVFKTHKLLFLSLWGHAVRFCEVPHWCYVCLPLPYPTLCLTLT